MFRSRSHPSEADLHPVWMVAPEFTLESIKYSPIRFSDGTIYVGSGIVNISRNLADEQRERDPVVKPVPSWYEDNPFPFPCNTRGKVF